MTRYDESTPELWQVPLRDTIVPDTVVTAPGAGYLVPSEYATLVASWLDAHGVAYRRLAQALEVDAQVFRADEARFAPDSVEGHQRVSLEGAWAPSREVLGAGALFVPVAQPLARLAIHILEPQAADSMAAWGLFNNAFERKEYMEAYVAEEVARDMLAKDPALKARFEQKLANEPDFAANPRARLDFFYRLHPAWDSGYMRYPVLRVDTPPQ